MTNRETLEFLFAKNLINIRRSKLFDSVPPALPTDPNFDRVEGMMLGLAVGDSLGNTAKDYPPPSGERNSVRCETTFRTSTRINAALACPATTRKWPSGP